MHATMLQLNSTSGLTSRGTMKHARNTVAIKFNFGVNKWWHNVGCRVAQAERSRSLSIEMRLTVAERSRSEQRNNDGEI